MKFINIVLTTSALSFACLTLSSCENTSVSGSVSYGMGMGYGYPMYYGNGYRRHSGVVVARPPIHNRPRPNRPSNLRPSRPQRR
ncbi:MAG: hypothetical protein JJV99_05960 [Colwellia sp.]|nr:hypothetical protein [Colwellia sp.]